jgi:NAD(P)H-nitrite reductase large subunit
MTTVEQIVAKLPPIWQKDVDENLCVCNQVLKRDIIQAILNGADTVEQVCAKTYATDGNGCCRHQVRGLIQVIQAQIND